MTAQPKRASQYDTRQPTFRDQYFSSGTVLPLSGRTVSQRVQLTVVMQQPAGEFQSLGEQTVGHFALVAYIPNPLARFLDDLRLELTPGSRPHAHVTILPPRPLDEDLKHTICQIERDIRGVAPFRVELSDIAVFEASQVIYLGLRRGKKELYALYNALNCGCLEYAENFPYHPHITIAQNVPPGELSRITSIARERWAAYKGPRSFVVSVLSFVQHVAPSIWTDVAALPLDIEVAVSR